MKKGNIVKLILIAVAFIFSIASFTIYAWYTNVDYVGSLDAEAEGLSFYYTLGDSTSKNVKSYDIKNLAFFDPQSNSEIRYFDSMSTKVSIGLANNDDLDKEYTITYVAKKRVTKENQVNKSVAYPAGIISEAQSLVTDNIKNVGELIAGNNVTSNETEFSYSFNGQIKGKTNKTVYLYLAGIQEIATASNNDFLINEAGQKISYSFKLTIQAKNISTGPSVN